MWSVLCAFVLAPPVARALLRFPCGEHTVTRADPLISPGSVSAHVHQVVGGNAFDFQMAAGMDLATTATCSTCSFKENKSNYWTADLYFQSPKNGTFKRVQRQTGPLLGNPTGGGIVVYYIQTPGASSTTAFPKSFRMISGDPMLRSYDSSIADSRSILHRCLQSDRSSGPDTPGLPTTNCVGGIRTQVNFPSCWDGKNVDSTNHKSHVAYATGASFGNFGQGCPSTHPVQLPILYLETYWDTAPFANEWQGGKQPFVWAMGDPTGYGYHADYMMGWEGDSLVRAMAQCNDYGGACPLLGTRAEQDMNDCAVPNRVDEEIDGWLTKLPGCNPIQAGPGRATVPSSCDAPDEILPKTNVSFLKTGITGWTPVGCASETGSENLLGGARTTMGQMTVEQCLNYCNTQGQTYAGLKNKNTCSCGNNLDTSKVSSNYACDMQCPGDLNEYCGSANRVAVYSGKGPVSVPPAPTSTSGSTPTQPPGNPPGTLIPKWGQCGGQGWTGGTQCEAGATCTAQNQWYSQCI